MWLTKVFFIVIIVVITDHHYHHAHHRQEGLHLHDQSKATETILHIISIYTSIRPRTAANQIDLPGLSTFYVFLWSKHRCTWGYLQTKIDVPNRIWCIDFLAKGPIQWAYHRPKYIGIWAGWDMRLSFDWTKTCRMKMLMEHSLLHIANIIHWLYSPSWDLCSSSRSM